MAVQAWLVKIGGSNSYVRETDRLLRLAEGSEPPAAPPETGSELYLLDTQSKTLSGGWVAASGCTRATVVLGQGSEDRRGRLKLGEQKERDKHQGLVPHLAVNDIAEWGHLPPLSLMEEYQLDYLLHVLTMSKEAVQAAVLAAKEPRSQRKKPKTSSAGSTWPWLSDAGVDPDLAIRVSAAISPDVDTEVSSGQAHTASTASAAGSSSAHGKRPSPARSAATPQSNRKRPANISKGRGAAASGRGGRDPGHRGRAGRGSAASSRRPCRAAPPSDTAPPVRRLPTNWPPDVVYTPYLLYAGGTIATTHPTAPGWPALQRSWELSLACANVEPISGVEIRPLPADGHCGEGQSGLFATAQIPGGRVLGDYTGVVLESGGEGDVNDSLYVVSMEVPQPNAPPPLRLDVDAHHYGNEFRFINDFQFHSLATAPNVEMRPRQCEHTGRWRLQVHALRTIQAGEELMLEYGEDYFQAVETCAMEAEVIFKLSRNNRQVRGNIFLDDTVAEVARKCWALLAERGEVPMGAHRLRVIFNGRELDRKNEKVGAYSVQKHSTLYVVFESVGSEGGGGGSGHGGGGGGGESGSGSWSEGGGGGGEGCCAGEGVGEGGQSRGAGVGGAVVKMER